LRFLDANIFIYAYYKPKKTLTEKEDAMKEQARRIIKNISDGKEEVITTVVHISEIVNILKKGMTNEELTNTIRGLFMLDNITIIDATKDAYFAAVVLGDDFKLEPNDALAVDLMRQNNISEIYSFDEHFDKIDEITRLPNV
jgi:predicted nucleic acid-binding protein